MPGDGDNSLEPVLGRHLIIRPREGRGERRPPPGDNPSPCRRGAGRGLGGGLAPNSSGKGLEDFPPFDRPSLEAFFHAAVMSEYLSRDQFLKMSPTR